MHDYDPSAPVMDIEGFTEAMSVDEVAQIGSQETTEMQALLAAAEASMTQEAAVSSAVTAAIDTHRVSGRYKSCPRPWELELRVDVDGVRPMRCVSGDYFHHSGSTVSYFGSFIVNAPTISVSTNYVIITGTANTTWATSFNKLRVIIPRNRVQVPRADAYATWMTANNQYGATYICHFESTYFRTIELEQDGETAVTPFLSYNTGSLPSGGPARTLTVARAYAEAGVQIRDTGGANMVAVAPGGTWSNAELHAAMVSQFSKWKDEPQWKVWLLHAMRHDIGPGLRGIMFDQQDKQRQGCAAFYQVIQGNSATKLRDQLYVCVHELGHCFNLFHSFHKKYMTPPQPNRLAALSWMNYPQNFPGGAAAFWAAFPFQFDNPEVKHLRHAFRNNIIIGGNPFGTGAALVDDAALSDSVTDNSGLRLALEARESFALGEPVVTEIKLYLTDTRGKRVHKHLHPNFGFVQILIQKPGGEVVPYEPPIEHCIDVETTMLDSDHPSIYESAYIGYGKDGHVFDTPGVYKLRGIYYALDGSVVQSEVISLRVRTPFNTTDEEGADLFLGEEQGMLLYLLGSDADELQSGNEAFEQILEKHADSPLAVYAQLIKGCNAAREFKTITDDQQVSVRDPQPEVATKMLSAVIDASEGEGGVDNITLNMVMQRLTHAQIAAGDKKGARATIKRMSDTLPGKTARPHVKALIDSQIAALKEAL